MDLFTAAEKTALQGYLNDVWDTFKVPVTGYKKVNVESFAENVNYNHLYRDNQPSVSITTNTVSGVFNATVNYFEIGKISEYFKEIVLDDVTYKKGGALVKLSCDKEGYNWLKDSVYIKLDDLTFKRVTEARARGLFGPNHWDFWIAETI